MIGFFPIQITRTGEVKIVERLGKFKKTLQPGLGFICPFIDRVSKKVSIKQEIIDLPPSNMITKDNVSVAIDTVIFYKVLEPQKAVYKIENFKNGIAYSAVTNLRSLVGSMTLDQVLSDRKTINENLLSVIDEITDEYGVKVISVEIQDIKPPATILEAMEKEMNAERNKRAMILNSEGIKQSEITKAQGEKESVILQAQAQKEKILLDADAEAEYRKKVADAEKYALQQIIAAIGSEDKLLELKQLEGIIEMSKGSSNKLIIPSDTLNTLGTLNSIINSLDLNKDNEKGV